MCWRRKIAGRRDGDGGEGIGGGGVEAVMIEERRQVGIIMSNEQHNKQYSVTTTCVIQAIIFRILRPPMCRK